MKFKLTFQIFLLFSFIIILSISIFTLLTNARLDSIYSSMTIEGINDFVEYTESTWNKGQVPISSKYQVIVGNSNGDLKYSDNLFNIISVESKDEMINDLFNSKEHKFSNVYKGTNEYVYISGKVNKDKQFMIAIIDSSTVQSMRDSSFSNFTIIFGVILLWGNAIVGIWSQQIVSRLKKIQKAVTMLPVSNYAKSLNVAGEDEISQLASSIETMRQEIYSNNEIKKEMLQNVSHDFKTPIAVIKSYSEAIIDGIENKDGAKIILKQAEILKKKAEQLLQYNRLEYLETQSDFENVNMLEVIENLVQTYIYQTDVKINTELEMVYFKGFSENYYTVITNILDNAIRYAKTTINITLKDDCLEIYNDGENIDPEFINNMYKPYEKGHKGQFGLGMSIVKRTLDHFQMNIEAINKEVGVSFIIKKK